ncbi:MAG: class II aldolase [Anaerolineae bacterium]|nr:class II aldolase [Anaerolineae bacterium]
MGKLTASLEALVEMSRQLGHPERGYVILGEGNTAAREDDGSFWVKASGYSLREIGPDGFVRVAFEPLFEALGRPPDDELAAETLQAAKMETDAPRPSVETFLHAIAIREAGARFVGHTHPVSVNRVLCSRMAEEAVSGRLFPDEVVSCGPASLYLPYCDPGVTLAQEFRASLGRFLKQHGQPPRVVLIQNHGLIALGDSPAEVLATTAMACKAFDILWGTYALGGPRFLPHAEVDRIAGRQDEHYRRRLINQRQA